MATFVRYELDRRQGVTYDGLYLPDLVSVTEVQVQPFPSVDVSTAKVPGRPGEHVGSYELGPREIRLTLAVRMPSRHKLDAGRVLRALMPQLCKPEPRPLYLGDGRYINAMATDVSDAEYLGRVGRVELTMVAHDPFFYGAEHVERPGEFPVSGNWETWPTVEVSGVEGELVVANALSGERVRVPRVAGADARVAIDMGRQRATMGGEYLPVDLDVSDFFALQPGDARVTVSAGEATIRYRERYL